MMTLLIAGHETTAAVLTWTLHLLVQHPDAMARVVAEVRRAEMNRTCRNFTAAMDTVDFLRVGLPYHMHTHWFASLRSHVHHGDLVIIAC